MPGQKEKLSHIKIAAHEPPKNYGVVIDLAHAAKYKDKWIGVDEFKGECAAGVQYVFHKAGRPLGRVAKWKQGIKVRGNNVKPGTAIASFRNGKYRRDHAAIFIKEVKGGLWVWDQFNLPPKAWGKRLLSFNATRHVYSNNGDYFYTIEIDIED